MQWQYLKLDLGTLPRRTEDVDVLNDAGADGWELVAIISNNIAYLKRPREGLKTSKPRTGK